MSEKQPPTDKAETTNKRRRSRGLRALAESLPKVTRPLFGRQGLDAGGLLHDWPDIVGGELAALCQPRRLSFPRRDRRSDGTLTLRVVPGQAVVVQHLEGPIRERVNGYLGYAAVARLRLQQGPLGPGKQHPKPMPAKLSPAQEAELAAKTDSIGDEALRQALTRLGRSVMAHRPGKDGQNTQS